MINRMKILVVEDEILIATSLCLDLQDNGLDTFEPVTQGEKAVEIALAQKPDLIIMDIRLAGDLDGIEAARLIKEQIDIPVIFVSGFATDHIKEKASVVKYLEFFEKPISINNLVSVISKMQGI